MFASSKKTNYPKFTMLRDHEGVALELVLPNDRYVQQDCSPPSSPNSDICDVEEDFHNHDSTDEKHVISPVRDVSLTVKVCGKGTWCVRHRHSIRSVSTPWSAKHKR